jgi:hypothetical protein
VKQADAAPWVDFAKVRQQGGIIAPHWAAVLARR